MDNSSISSTKLRKRDQLLSFVQSKSSVLKQEFNRYYTSSSSVPNLASGSISTRSTSSLNEEGSCRAVQRTDTQEIDDILQDNTPETSQPQCILFPTYAAPCQDAGYKVTLSGWAFTKPSSSRLDRWLLAAGRSYGGLERNSVEDHHFSNLLNHFRSQSIRMTEIALALPSLIKEHVAAQINTGPTGRFQQEIYLDPHVKGPCRVEASFLTDSAKVIASTSIDVVDSIGISVISDIDDTIKITGVLDGKDTILQNTFFRKARQVPHMSEVFQNWASSGAHIHYVSNSPWQVFPALNEFMTQQKFPQGSIHLRNIGTGDLLRNKPGKHKLEVIPSILRDFPQRKFILVGDSGEMDPEIYQQIYEMFPDQVIKIFIHDVTSERAMNADRLARDRPDSYYSSVRKFLSRESILRKGSSSQLAMDAMAQTEIPEEQQDVDDPQVPLMTKLEQFEARMKRVSGQLPEGLFTIFTLATQLMLDPVVAENFLACSSS
ncbi:hypothetical protein BD560DRAFT_493977 [Blakeslea trispora]|nr:hypothetical protein BD560DRAFT_493977 [Blakeslea trispora]